MTNGDSSSFKVYLLWSPFILFEIYFLQQDFVLSANFLNLRKFVKSFCRDEIELRNTIVS
jgi:hypothetical protein